MLTNWLFPCLHVSLFINPIMTRDCVIIITCTFLLREVLRVLDSKSSLDFARASSLGMPQTIKEPRPPCSPPALHRSFQGLAMSLSRTNTPEYQIVQRLVPNLTSIFVKDQHMLTVSIVHLIGWNSIIANRLMSSLKGEF